MGFMANLKGQQALSLQGKKKMEEAKAKYAEAYAEGMDQPRLLLAYAVLLIRDNEFQKAKELLAKMQKSPMSPDQKNQMYMDYAVCCYKLGDLAKAVNLLEKQHRRQHSGLVYETLGYLYAEQFDPANKAAFLAQPHVVEVDDRFGDEAPEIDPEQAWEEGKQKALAFNQEAVEYDDEDSVSLDNLGQTYYRVLGDKETALTWFTKALEQKPGQIDTLWFLSRYDVDSKDYAAAIAKLEKALEGRFSPLNKVSKAEVEQEVARLKALL
ncbi:MAG: tetratricopeptide repeat protein [Clostridia bacterium]|nr:tetratricopeptide repeat protein [Clostridia bacterium]